VIPSALMVVNGKGGVLKTTLSANLAGLVAASGWRVLLVDLDPQANVEDDLGCRGRSDNGAGLLDAVLSGESLRVVEDVRPNLDWVPAGERTTDLLHILTMRMATGTDDQIGRLDAALRTVAERYNLVILDCPPRDPVLHRLAFQAAHFVVIPTKPDVSSIKGLAGVFKPFVAARATNPDLEVLGVVLGPIAVAATALERGVRAQLADLLGDDVHVFSTTIREATAAATDCRRLGKLVHEYEEAARQAQPWYANRSGERFSRAASGLAGDYESLAAEIVARYAERQAAYATERALLSVGVNQ
jgi:chromosome partitioning protein